MHLLFLDESGQIEHGGLFESSPALSLFPVDSGNYVIRQGTH
jgi:hypothetical protein